MVIETLLPRKKAEGFATAVIALRPKANVTENIEALGNVVVSTN
jgi:hypothetical protein